MSVDVYVAVHVLLQAILPYFVPFLIMLMPLSSLINLHNKARLLHPGLILSSFEVYSYGQAFSLCLCHPIVLAPAFPGSTTELPTMLPGFHVQYHISMCSISWTMDM